MAEMPMHIPFCKLSAAEVLYNIVLPAAVNQYAAIAWQNSFSCLVLIDAALVAACCKLDTNSQAPLATAGTCWCV